jgi:hypothetical protein
MTRVSKQSEIFDIEVFFDIEAKQTHLIVIKFISERSKHVYIEEFKIEAKRTRLIVLKFFPKQREHVYIKELKYRGEAS